MDVIGPIDIFATKGVEYLIVIGFLGILVLYWRVLSWTGEPAGAGARQHRRADWFSGRAGYLFHPGHAWVAPVNGKDVMRVGMDDFAQRVLGEVSGLDLPQPGERLVQGELGWKAQVEGRPIRMLSPVDGWVLDVNAEALRRPGIVHTEPYEGGWLLEVAVERPDRLKRNLLSGEVANTWLRATEERLRGLWSAELGFMLPDGGVPVRDFARAMADEHWERKAESLLLSDSLSIEQS